MPSPASCGASAPDGVGSGTVIGVAETVGGRPTGDEKLGRSVATGLPNDCVFVGGSVDWVLAGDWAVAASTRRAAPPAPARDPSAAATITPATASRFLRDVHTGGRNHTSAWAG